MDYWRARTFAVCAVKLDDDHSDAAEGTFDAALTNALVAIVASEWAGEERKSKNPASSQTQPASFLLKLIRKKAGEAGGVVRPVPEEPDVFLIRDPHAEEGAGDTAAPPGTEASREEPQDSLFSWPQQAAPPLETRIDVGTLLDALDVTQPVRHARGDGDEEGAERRLLGRRHVDALLALDGHHSLWALDTEREDRYEQSAQRQDGREMERACRTLERIGEEEADRRAAAAENLHMGPSPGDPYAMELQDCPVCGYEAFSSADGDELGMQIGAGECLVCHYRRSQAIANALGVQMWWEARGDRD